MIDREKLVEMINKGVEIYSDGYQIKIAAAETIADHLIANGVVVQEWISVKDRLPDDQRNILTVNGHGLIRIMGLYHKRGEKWSWVHSERIKHYNDITCWMPIPEPPKEDTNA